jgi:hypothetical protein
MKTFIKYFLIGSWVLFLAHPLNSAFAIDGWGGDAPGGNTSADGGGFNGGCEDRYGGCGGKSEEPVCEEKPTKVTKCESDEFHPLTLRCLSEEVVNHPNGYFFTNDEVCIPSINGPKTHCTKMPAWDGCSREKKLKGITFKIPAPFPACFAENTTGSIGQSTNWGVADPINQKQAYIQASSNMCSCFNNSMAQIRELIKDHPVEKEEDISKKISELLAVAKQCKDISSTLLDKDLGCHEEGNCESGASVVSPDKRNSSGSSQSSGISGDAAKEKLSGASKPNEQAYRDSGISLSPLGDVGDFSPTPPEKAPAAPANEEYTWGTGKGSGGDRAPASSGLDSSLSGSKSSSAMEIGSTTLRSTKDTLPGTVKREGLSEEILQELDRKGMYEQTIFQIVNRKYKSRQFELVKPKW